jgi:hypothetical protein
MGKFSKLICRDSRFRTARSSKPELNGVVDFLFWFHFVPIRLSAYSSSNVSAPALTVESSLFGSLKDIHSLKILCHIFCNSCSNVSRSLFGDARFEVWSGNQMLRIRFSRLSWVLISVLRKCLETGTPYSSAIPSNLEPYYTNRT